VTDSGSASDAALVRLRAPHAGVDAVHFNHAGFAPMCQAAREAGAAMLARMQQGTAGEADLLGDYF